MIAALALVRRHARIERRAPATVNDVDIGRRIDSRHHRPEHFFLVGRIDILIDHDDVATVARRRGAAHGRQPGLLGVASVLLVDRNDGQVGGMVVHANDVLNTRAFELIPKNTG